MVWNLDKINTPEKRVERIFQLMVHKLWIQLMVHKLWIRYVLIIMKILWNSNFVTDRTRKTPFHFKTEMGAYQKKSFSKVQNKTNRLFKLFHFTMVLFRFHSESTFFSMRHMIQPNMSSYVYKIFKNTVNYTLNKAT